MSLYNRNVREQLELLESKNLSSTAMLSMKSKGRIKKEAANFFQTIFMEDRDRIIQSEAFRRLKHKTQVFLIPSNDLYRTRLTHTLEVSILARTIARVLRLNEDLSEAITLAHDLGHPPFGHAGEEILNEIYKEGFYHSLHSLRMVDKLEGGSGLNLSFEVRDGIIKHSKGMGSIKPKDYKEQANTLEGQIVRLSDRISYVSHDLDDAIRAEILDRKNIPQFIHIILKEDYQNFLNKILNNITITSINNLNSILISSDLEKEIDDLKDFLYQNVYKHPSIISQANKAKKIIEDLYYYFKKNPKIILKKMKYINYDSENIEERIVDYISMMTDQFAIREHEKYLIPKKWFTLNRLE